MDGRSVQLQGIKDYKRNLRLKNSCALKLNFDIYLVSCVFLILHFFSQGKDISQSCTELMKGK